MIKWKAFACVKTCSSVSHHQQTQVHQASTHLQLYQTTLVTKFPLLTSHDYLPTTSRTGLHNYSTLQRTPGIHLRSVRPSCWQPHTRWSFLQTSFFKNTPTVSRCFECSSYWHFCHTTGSPMWTNSFVAKLHWEAAKKHYVILFKLHFSLWDFILDRTLYTIAK